MTGIKKFIKLHKLAFFLFFAFVVIATISGRMAFDRDVESAKGGPRTSSGNVEVDENVEKIVEASHDLPEEKGEDIKEIEEIKGIVEEEKTKIESDVESEEDGEVVVEDQPAVEMLVGDREYKVGVREGQTVYEVMQTLTAMSVQPFLFFAEEYPGLGFFVTEINGVKNNPQTGEYWIYYVDGQSAKIGVSNYILKGGEKIEWKYEKSKL